MTGPIEAGSPPEESTFRRPSGIGLFGWIYYRVLVPAVIAGLVTVSGVVAYLGVAGDIRPAWSAVGSGIFALVAVWMYAQEILAYRRKRGVELRVDLAGIELRLGRSTRSVAWPEIDGLRRLPAHEEAPARLEFSVKGGRSLEVPIEGAPEAFLARLAELATGPAIARFRQRLDRDGEVHLADPWPRDGLRNPLSPDPVLFGCLGLALSAVRLGRLVEVVHAGFAISTDLGRIGRGVVLSRTGVRPKGTPPGAELRWQDVGRVVRVENGLRLEGPTPEALVCVSVLAQDFYALAAWLRGVLPVSTDWRDARIAIAPDLAPDR